MREAERALTFARQKFYETGNQAHTTLGNGKMIRLQNQPQL